MRHFAIVWLALCCAAAFFCGCQKSRVSVRGPKYSSEQWLQMVQQRQHQPRAWWKGITPGSISDQRAGCSLPGLQIDSTPAGEMELYLPENLLQDPLFLLNDFRRNDRDAALTMIYVYDLVMPAKLKRPYRLEIATALRAMAGHSDSAIRTTALRTLQTNRWLQFEDVERGMNDEQLSVQFLASVYASGLIDKDIVYDARGQRAPGSGADAAKQVVLKRRLAALALDHLNDAHFLVRYNVGSICRRVGLRRVRTETGVRELNPPEFPEYFDWIKSSYAERAAMQKQWKAWWAEHGEETLAFAHPDANAPVAEDCLR